MRLCIEPAEAIRNERQLNPREFSIALGLNPNTYPIAHSRGYITPRIAREVSVRFKVKMALFVPVPVTETGGEAA